MLSRMPGSDMLSDILSDILRHMSKGRTGM